MSRFLSAFYKLAAARKEVSVCGVVYDGKLLMGRRRDNGKWTNPGGHLDPGEDPVAGAKRELMEEAGMEVDTIKHLETRDVTTKKGEAYRIHAYLVTVKDPKHSMKEDPDAEVHRWHWLSTSNGLSKDVLDNLHSPDNVLLQAMDLQPRQAEKAAARRLPLPKKEDFMNAAQEGFVQGVQIYADRRSKKRDNYVHGRPH